MAVERISSGSRFEGAVDGSRVVVDDGLASGLGTEGFADSDGSPNGGRARISHRP